MPLTLLMPLLTPNRAQNGLIHLGGLAYSVIIDGETETAPGDITGKAIAVVPITILLP
ncbi:MAG: hypothetical protein WDN29_16280 [Methylovirgula sp.]